MNGKSNQNDGESDHKGEDLGYIRSHVDNIERMVWFQLASSPNCEAYVTKQFKAKANSAKVYLLLENGPRSQDDLIKGAKMSRANVSKILTYLEEQHFVVNQRGADQKLLFRWTEAERQLQLSKVAKQLTK